MEQVYVMVMLVRNRYNLHYDVIHPHLRWLYRINQHSALKYAGLPIGSKPLDFRLTHYYFGWRTEYRAAEVKGRQMHRPGDYIKFT